MLTLVASVLLTIGGGTDRIGGMTTAARAALVAARRALGWSQAQAARELAALARTRGAPAAVPASLKTQLSRWENGHVLPEATYRTLLAELYGRSTAELGLSPPPPAEHPAEPGDRLRAHLALGAAVDDDVLGLWTRQLETLRGLDRRLGAAGAGPGVRALTGELERVAAHCLDPHRRRAVLAMLAAASLLAAEQALDTGESEEAWARHTLALDAAGAAAEAGLVAEALAGRAAVLVEVGEAAAAVAVLEVPAREAAGVIGVRLGLALGAARAAVGDEACALATFARAERALREFVVSAPRTPSTRTPSTRTPSTRTPSTRPAAGPPLGAATETGPPDLATTPAVEIELADLHRARGHALVVLGAPGAAGPLAAALAAGPPAGRARAALHADLAVALAGDAPDQAADHAAAARSLAERIGSVRVARLLDGLPAPPSTPERPTSRLATAARRARRADGPS
jgi:transcriptional regulator with XRE-family HTH domain